MKSLVKMISVFFLLVSSFFFLTSNANAQDFTPIESGFNSQKAYEDYVYTRSLYDTAYRDYEIKKDVYLKNPTLTLKEEARVATLEMLRARDDLHRVYLTAVRTKLSEIKGLTIDERGGAFSRLDSEVIWYTDHKSRYIANETVDELFRINADVEARYKTKTLPIIQDALWTISYGQEVGIRQDHETIYKTLTDFLNQKVTLGVLRIDPFNRWFLDIGATLITLQKNESTAKTNIQKLFSDKNVINSTYPKALTPLRNSITELNKLNRFTTEFLTAIENQI